MSASVNQVFLLGRIGADAETRRHGDSTVSRLSLATDRRSKGADGEWKRQTEWHLVAIWSASRPSESEGLGPYLTKGSRIHVQGRMRTHSWTDDVSGERRYRTEVVARATDVTLLGKPRPRASPPEEPRSSSQGASREPDAPAPTTDDNGNVIPFHASR